MEHIPSELERVLSASQEAKEWFNKRVKERDWVVNETPDEVPCFFCGENITHCNENGTGWYFNVNIETGKHLTASYCADDCTGKLKSSASENAKNYLIWRQTDNNDLSYYEIIGAEGFNGVTPATTKYKDTF